MVWLIKESLNAATQVFDMATMKGVYLLPVLAGAIYIIQSKDEADRSFTQKVLFPCAIAILLLLTPIFGLIGKNQMETRLLRFYWTLPLGVIALYSVVSILFRVKGKVQKGLILCTTLMVLFCFSRQDNLTYPKVEQKWPWVKAENLYKVPQSVYELCNIIQNAQHGEPCRAAFPFGLAECVRQYDASIDMPYGAYWDESYIEIFAAVNAEEIDLDEVGKKATDEDLDYIVLNQSKIATGSLEKYHYEELQSVQDENTTYVVYKRN